VEGKGYGDDFDVCVRYDACVVIIPIALLAECLLVTDPFEAQRIIAYHSVDTGILKIDTGSGISGS
jgi:hypothetical protein